MTKSQRRRQWALRRFDFDYAAHYASHTSYCVAKLHKQFQTRPAWAIDVKLTRPSSEPGTRLQTQYLHKSGSWLPLARFTEKLLIPALDSGRIRHMSYHFTHYTMKCAHGTEWDVQVVSLNSAPARGHGVYYGPCAKCLHQYKEHNGCGTIDQRLDAYSTGRLDPNHISELYVLDVVAPSDISLERPVVLYGIGVSAKPRIYEHRIKCPSGLEELLVLQGRDEWIVHVEDYLKEHVTKPQGGRRPSYKATEYLTGARRDAWREHLDAAMRHADTITNRYLPKAS